METVRRIIIKHIDGHPVNLRYEPVQSLSRAARFPTIEDYQTFITGHYKPPDTSKYEPKTIEITYREVTEDE
jgi:hypothetical protein